MRWTPGGPSADVEDRRGQSYGGGFRGGPASIGVMLVLLVLSLLTGRNFLALLGPGGVETTSDAPTESGGPRRQRIARGEAALSIRQFRRGRRTEDVAAVAGERVSKCDRRGVSRGDADGVRRRAVGDGPVLLPGRREGLHRPGFLRRTAPPFRRVGRLRAGLRRSRTSSGTTCSICAASMRRCASFRNRVRTRRTSSPCGWSSKPIASRACGAIRRRSATSSSRGTSKRRSTRRRRLATIGFSALCGRGVQPDSFTHGSSAQRVAVVPPRAGERRLNGCDTFGRGSDSGRVLCLLPDRRDRIDPQPRQRSDEIRGRKDEDRHLPVAARPAGSSGSSTAPAARRPSPSCS